MKAWSQKVVKCSELPAAAKQNLYYGSDMVGVEELWLTLANEWKPANNTFNGCGYVGTKDNIEVYGFGSAADGCSPSSTGGQLVWLWVVLGIAGVLIVVVGCICCVSKARSGNSKQQEEAMLVAHADTGK